MGDDVLQGKVAGLKALLNSILYFIGISVWVLIEFQGNVLRTLPSASLLKDLEKVDCSSRVS